METAMSILKALLEPAQETIVGHTVRIELIDVAKPEEENLYNTLHEAMGKAGFRRTIQGKDGLEYRLPRAEYDYRDNGHPTTILEKARGAAEETNHKARIVVTCGVRYIAGLDQDK